MIIKYIHNGIKGIKHFSLKYKPPFNKNLKNGINKINKIHDPVIILYFFLVKNKYSIDIKEITVNPIAYVPEKILENFKLGINIFTKSIFVSLCPLPCKRVYNVGTSKILAINIEIKTIIIKTPNFFIKSLKTNLSFILK